MSDLASRASGSAQARRAGSLTPRVGVQFVRTTAARIAFGSAPSFVRRSRSTIAPAIVLVIELPRCVL